MSSSYWVVHLSIYTDVSNTPAVGQKTTHSFLWSLKPSQGTVGDELPFYMFISPDQTSQRTSVLLIEFPAPSMVIAYGEHNGIFPSPDLKQIVKDYFSNLHICLRIQNGTKPITYKQTDLHLNHFVLECVIKMIGNQNNLKH